MPVNNPLNIQQVFRGLGSGLLQFYTQDFDPQRGFIYKAEWRGFYPKAYNDLQAIAQDNVNAGIACSLTVERGEVILTAEDATQQYTIDTWEMPDSTESVDGFQHPYVVSLIGNATGVMPAIREHLAAFDDPTTAFADPALAGFGNPTLMGVYSLALAGGTDFLVTRYILRHTVNISNRWNPNLAAVVDAGIGQIYTTAQLLSEATTGWFYPLPGWLQYKISNLPPPLGVSSAANFLLGWLKRAGTVTPAANNRLNLEYEYEYNLWSTFYYTPKP